MNLYLLSCFAFTCFHCGCYNYLQSALSVITCKLTDTGAIQVYIIIISCFAAKRSEAQRSAAKRSETGFVFVKVFLFYFLLAVSQRSAAKQVFFFKIISCFAAKRSETGFVFVKVFF